MHRSALLDVAILQLCISGHGFGHLSQVGSVIQELRKRLPDLQLHVRSALPEEVVTNWLSYPVSQYIHTEDDIGMRMQDALAVDLPASYTAYEALHADWEEKVVSMGQQMRSDGVSLVYSDVPYFPLAAAKSVDIPSIAMCSLNWADIVERYFPERTDWLKNIREIYQSASTFLVPEPGMPMAWLDNQQAIGPVGRQGISRRGMINSQLGLMGDTCLVLVGMGGVHHPLDLSRWPCRVAGKPVHYLVPPSLDSQIVNASVASILPAGYADILASCDLVITKPGYGMFVEAAAAGVPVLYMRREGWPDVPSLTAWLHSVANAAEIEPEQLEDGRFAPIMERLLVAGKYPPVALTGAAQAADILTSYLA